MSPTWLLCVLTLVDFYLVLGEDSFSTGGCVATHNLLRQKHVATAEVTGTDTLHLMAGMYASILSGKDGSRNTHNVHPTRSPPKRKRRSLEDGVDENKHLEMYDGYIEYPTPKPNWLTEINEGRSLSEHITMSIHKFCCESFPHCPREFFHDLSFPPSAGSVVKDIYEQEERYYDYEGGKTKTIYSHIDHFARIIWKNTTVVGCAQSEMSDDTCFYTVFLYQKGGAVGDTENYVKNIGIRVVPEDKKMKKVTKIVLICFIVGLVLGLLILLYCCRHKIKEKYSNVMTEVDVLKAEQELETDSTKLWWTRPLKRQDKKSLTPTKPAQPDYKYTQVKSQTKDDVITPLTTTRSKPPPPANDKFRRVSLKNVPRSTPSVTSPTAPNPPADVNQLVNRYKGMSLKRNDYKQLNPRLPPPGRPLMPPGKPLPPAPRFDNRAMDGAPGPSAPVRPPPRVVEPKPSDVTSAEKPRPAPRVRKPPGDAGTQEVPSEKKLLLPSKPLPKTPSETDPEGEDEDRPMSVAERRKMLEKK